MAKLVPTRLRAGDELGSFQGHVVPRDRNLSELYRVSPERIVTEFNRVPFTAEAIEGDGGWIQRSGSKTKIGKRWVFDANTVILLPEGGPRPPAISINPPAPPPSGGGGLLVGGGLLALLVGWFFLGD